MNQNEWNRNHCRWKKFWCRAALAAAIGILAAFPASAEENQFVQGTTVNGLGISGMTVEEAASHIRDFYHKDYQLVLKERGIREEVISGSEFGFTAGISEEFLQAILDQQNAAGRACGPEVDNAHRIQMSNVYDEAALERRIRNLYCVSDDATATTDAHVSPYQEGEPFVIVPEVRGSRAELESVKAAVKAAVAAGVRELDLEAAGCYVEPQVVSSDPRLQSQCDARNQYRDISVTYVFGEEQQVIGPEMTSLLVLGMENGQVQVDRALAQTYVQALADSYDTSGKQRIFTTAAGTQVLLQGPYGWRIDQNAETDALIAAIQSGQPQTREPIYRAAAASRTGSEWGSTYAEVDLTGQQVHLTVDGQVVWSSPCVTGNLARHHDTPSGIYSITYKERDRVLRGEKQADGTYEYESWVGYWMPFNGGIGFHDANWRGSFGGDIFRTNGSHGCINLPPANVPAFYEAVYKGMPVFCYSAADIVVQEAETDSEAEAAADEATARETVNAEGVGESVAAEEAEETEASRMAERAEELTSNMQRDCPA